MEQRKDRKDIQPGDRVWVGDGKDNRRKLCTVAKVTPKQIVLGAWAERYSRDNFRSVSPHSYFPLLSDVATAEEVEAWDANQSAKRRQREEADVERQRTATRRAELNELFGPNAYVNESDEPERGAWKVRLYLSEQGVRRLAELLRDNPTD